MFGIFALDDCEIHQSPGIRDKTLLLQWVGELEMCHMAKLWGNKEEYDTLKKLKDNK